MAWWQQGQGPNQQSLDTVRGETRDEPRHMNEATGQPCTFCKIPVTDPEKAYDQCPGVPTMDERRLQVRDYGKPRVEAPEPVVEIFFPKFIGEIHPCWPRARSDA